MPLSNNELSWELMRSLYPGDAFLTLDAVIAKATIDKVLEESRPEGRFTPTDDPPDAAAVQ